jgi:4,5-DOPA dioxygenase extradiol
MTSLPALFISHGSPLQAVDGGRTTEAWRALAAELPRPRAVLAVSAHWETPAPVVSGAERPETIHDFGGFPGALFEIQYPAPGSPWLAGRVRDLLSADGFEVTVDPQRGLDHGAWVPLRAMYPDAGVPIAQLSIQPHLGPEHHVRLGRALAPLRDEGVLIAATGSMTHNLRDWRPVHRAEGDSPPLPYVPAFQEWMHDKLTRNDIDALVDYRQRAPGAVRAHPSDEHLLPLYVAIGAGGSAVRRVHGDIKEAALAMDAYTFSDR